MIYRTTIDRIDVGAGGELFVRMIKGAYGDDGALVGGEYHRITIMPGTDPAAVLEAVNSDLSSMENTGTVSGLEWQVVIDKVAEVHTPSVIEAYQVPRTGIEQ